MIEDIPDEIHDKHLIGEKGVVSLWIGSANSIDDLERYVEFPWQDGEPDLTNFCWNFGFNWFDEDFCEISVRSEGATRDFAMLFLHEVLPDKVSSFYIPIRDRFMKVAGELTSTYNSTILLYNYRYIPDASWIAPSGSYRSNGVCRCCSIRMGT